MSAPIHIRTSTSQPFVILPAFINERGPFDFVLDTGAGISIITEEIARTLDIKNVEVKEGLGAGGKKIAVSVGQADSIVVGGGRIENAKLGIMKTLPKCIGDGVLGYDFLRHFVLTIDYPRNVLVLAHDGIDRNVPSSNRATLPLRLARPDRPLILVDVLVNGGNTYQFVLDTGASQTVISPELAERMSVTSTSGDFVVGAGGIVASSGGTLKSIQMGTILLEGVLVVVADVFSPLSHAVGTTLDGILGYNVLAKFTLTVDYPNEKLHFA